MATRERLRRITSAVWGIGLALILVFGAAQYRSSLNEATVLDRKLQLVENAPSDGPLLLKFRAHIERTRGHSPGDLEGTAWREDLARTFRDQALLLRARAHKAWTRAWLIVGGSWTGAVWGLYLVSGWIRREFGSNSK